MCGIFGLISKKPFNIKNVLIYFSKLKHRGDDFVYILYKNREDKYFNIEKAKNFDSLIEKFDDEKAEILIGMNYFSIFGKPKVYNNFVFNGEVFNIEEMQKLFNLKKIENDGILIKKAFENNKLEKLNAIYAFAYFKDNKLFLRRDPIGVNPLFYNLTDDFFIFSSENKTCLGRALNPRFQAEFHIKNFKLILKKTSNLFKKRKNKNLIKSIEKSLINNILLQTEKIEGVGVLFSGGLDSTFLAKILQEHNRKFICLISGTEDSKDVYYAEKVAEEFGFNYKIKLFNKEEVKENLKEIIYYLETTDLMKVSVAIPFYFAGKLNPHKVILSGIGSEELFGGYERHKKNVSEETLKGLKEIWDRDLYRDNVISFATGNELRVPFLNKDIIQYSLALPDNLKIRKPSLEELKKIKMFEENFNRECKKYVLRKIAEKYIGIYAWRPKKAAQYGSKSEKIIEKLAKEKGLYKKQYLCLFKPEYEKIEI
jgi:asparagine synthase (glutamine-hydrolysing)